MRLPSHRFWFRAWIVTFTGVMLWAGLTSLVSVGRANDAIDAIERRDQRDEARTCVVSWEVRQGIRDGIAKAANLSTEALIAVASADADPADIEAYRTYTAQGIADAVSEVPLPICDLDAARARLDD